MNFPSASTRRAGEATTSQGSSFHTHQYRDTASSEDDSGSYYIPPTSGLTSSDHDKALRVIDTAFKQTDMMLDERDMKAFGDNSESIFQELNTIRQKQLALAARHISIETVADDDKSLAPDGKILDAADKEELDPLHFARKGQELQELMSSLEDLGRSMSDFHELSNSNKQL
ncbi:hypothetical protein BGZ65_008939 [Modicella reniformis]|uniref:Uncharacterized protein n=1 Tax=Modicella reniformis TaxID=1440133 RepID=A0A9P6MAZ6_9FUNG|nr:hypothetical protein BGZ65_008939 [Modicella reniformis]